MKSEVFSTGPIGGLGSRKKGRGLLSEIVSLTGGFVFRGSLPGKGLGILCCLTTRDGRRGQGNYYGTKIGPSSFGGKFHNWPQKADKTSFRQGAGSGIGGGGGGGTESSTRVDICRARGLHQAIFLSSSSSRASHRLQFFESVSLGSLLR